MGSSEQACETCGEPSRVRILDRYAQGKPVFQVFCLQCVEQASPTTSESDEPRYRQAVPTLIATIGIALGILSAFGDHIPGFAGDNQAFGWHQRAGVAVGAVLIIVGAMLRTDLIALFGTGLFVMSLAADLFALERSPGMGWKQTTMVAVSAAVVVAALAWRFVIRPRIEQRATSNGLFAKANREAGGPLAAVGPTEMALNAGGSRSTKLPGNGNGNGIPAQRRY